MAASITLSLPEWQEKQDRIAQLEAELVTVRAELDAARTGGPEGDVGRMVTAFGHAFPIIQFAVANYAPRMWPGWPHADLEALAKLLPELPGIPEVMREIANDLQIFADDARGWEEARKDGTHEVKFLEENAAELDLPGELFEGASRILKP